MINLSGLSAVAPAYQSAVANQLQIQNGQTQQQAMAAYGAALAALAGQGGGSQQFMPTAGGGGQTATFAQVAPQPTPQPSPYLWRPGGIGAPMPQQAAQPPSPAPQQATYDPWKDPQAWLPPGMSTRLPPHPYSALPPGWSPGQPLPLDAGDAGSNPNIQMPSPAAPPSPPRQNALAPPQPPGQVTPPPTQPTAAGGGDMPQWKASISNIESGGDYSQLTPPNPKPGQDYAVGKYQVMASNIPEWTQEALGQSMTPEQFRASPEAQEKVFEHKFGGYAEKYGPQGAALAWFTGSPTPNPNVKDALGTTAQVYLTKFNAGLQGGSGGGGAPQQGGGQGIKLPSTQGVQPGSLTWPAVVLAIQKANPGIAPAALAGAVNNFVPLMNADQAQQWKAIDEKRSDYEAQTQRITASRAGIPSGYEADPDNPGGMRPISGGPADTDVQNVKTMVQGWMDGTVPVPPLSSINSTSKTMVAAKAEAKRQGFDLTKAAQDVTADVAYLRSANSGPQLKMREAIGTAQGMLDTLQSAVDEWDAGQFPILNKATIAAAKQGALGPEANRIATLLDAQIADATATLASAVMGGNTPTDRAFKLAAEQLQGNWSRATLDAAIKQARQNLNSRKTAMDEVRPVGTSGQPTQAAPAAPATGGSQPPPAAAKSAAPPKAGDVQNFNGTNYRFKGGDPGQQANWEPIA